MGRSRRPNSAVAVPLAYGDRQTPLTGVINPWAGLVYPARGIGGESFLTDGSDFVISAMGRWTCCPGRT